MSWFDSVGAFLMEHQMVCGLLAVGFLIIYCWVIYLEDKWG